MTSLSAVPRVRERPPAANLVRSTAHALQACVVTTREGFDAIADEWLALEAMAGGAVLFQSSGWARAVFDFEAQRGNLGFEPVIVTLMDGQRLVAVLPLERIRTRLRTVLAPLGHAFSQYSDAVVVTGANATEVVARLLRTAIDASPCDAVSFLKVRADSVLARGMPANHLVTGTEQGAPYVALDAFPDFASYFGTIKSKTRKNLRNTRNRLEREGTLEHVLAETAAEKLGVIRRTLDGRAGRLKDQGLTSRAFRDTAFADFCQSLSARDDMSIMAMSLRHDGQPIAEQWGFVHNQRYYAFIASRDFSNSEESPGRMHLGEVIETCASHGLRGADLMVPVMPYKLTWSTEVMTVKDYALPVTPRGILIVHLWDRTLRPALKNAVLNMPRGLRSALMKLTGRSL